MTERNILYVTLAALAGALLTTPTIFLGDVLAGALIVGGIVAVILFVRNRRTTI